MDLKQWGVFKNLDPVFASEVKIASVAHPIQGQDEGDLGIVVMNNDNVYGLISSKYLRTDDIQLPRNIPLKLNILCKKGVKEIISGVDNMLILTAEGQLYGWGLNEYYELGLGHDGMSMEPQRIVALAGHNVIQVACGQLHTLAVTADGLVYGWGGNNYGQIGSGASAEEHRHPVRLEGDISNVKITSVACGSSSSFALSELGEVFAWGCNETGELGFGTTGAQRRPKRIIIEPEVIKIVCGAKHTIALTRQGALLCWGSNFQGSLGFPDSPTTIIRPRKLQYNEEIQDIAASNMCSFSVCLIGGCVHIWGKFWNQIKKSPTKTLLTSMEQAFWSVGKQRIMLKQLENPVRRDTLADTFEQLFDNAGSSDVKLCVQGEQIHAHKWILTARSKYFKGRLESGLSNEEVEDTITINEPFVTPSAFRSYIYFLYTDRITPGLLNELIDLVCLADFYNEEHLLLRCEDLMKPLIDVTNVCHLFYVGVSYHAKFLPRYCIEYAHSRFSQVLRSDGVSELEKEGMLVQFLRELEAIGTFAEGRGSRATAHRKHRINTRFISFLYASKYK